MEDKDSHTLINKLHRCELNIKKLDETPVHEDEITHHKSQGDPWCDKISKVEEGSPHCTINKRKPVCLHNHKTVINLLEI